MSDHELRPIVAPATFTPSRLMADHGILSTSQLVNNPFAVKTITPTQSVADSTDNKELRPIVAPATFTPSRLMADHDPGKSNSPSSSFKLNPPTLVNPFAKCDSISERRSDFAEVSTSKESESSNDSSIHDTSQNAKPVVTTVTFIPTNITSTVSATTEPTTGDSSVNNNSVAAENRFPAVSNAAQFNSFAQSAPSVDFVFGQKMDERVTNVVPMVQTASTSNGNAELRFSESSAEQLDSEAEETVPNGESASKTSKSLEQSAQEYESRKIKRTYQEVMVVTGEEEESNVLQINCKLFVFDNTSSSWLERGRGLLRLNDKEELQEGTLQSRLVMRTQGSLRVVLNTKVWAGMAVDQPSPKSVQITAMEGDGIKVFLIMASPKDADQLHSALNWRVTTLRTAEEQRPSDEQRVGDDAQNCQPSTTSEDSSSSPKRRRVSPPTGLEDDSCSSEEFGTNIQDTSIDSTSRNKAASFEADSGNLSSSSS